MKPKVNNQGLTLDKLDKTVKEAVRKISKAIKPEKVFLFGSRANGNSNRDSDIDLLLLYSGLEDKRTVRLKTHRLFDSPRFSLDIFVLTPQEFEEQRKVANTLAREVSERGIVCYG